MSPPMQVVGLRRGFGSSTEREKWDWSAVVARHVRDDWPPPGWMAQTIMAAGWSEPARSRAPKEQASVAA